jgi:serine phosphatase RsbU (regulator of sigma subunit)
MSLHLHEQDIAIIQELEEKNQQLAQAYHELQNAQQQIIEKERLEHELAVAHQIQSSLLPRHVPHMHGFSFGFYIDPAHAVGGDFFDFIPLNTETLGLVVADVSDKGVPAAIFMALARSVVREKARPSTPPGRMLRNVNRQLMEMSDSDMFVTVLYGLLDATSRRFTYARAGHEMPLLFDGTGALLPLAHATGQALGLFEDPLLDEGSLIIPPGGLLLLHSDGVTDAMDPHNHFGIEGIQAVLRQAAQAPADVICERIATAIAAHQERAAQFDDITLVAVRAD